MTAKDEHLRDLIAEQAADFFVAHRVSTPGDEQQQEFFHWLRTSPVHVAEYLSVANLARDLAAAAKVIDTPLDELITVADQGGEIIALNAAPIQKEKLDEVEHRHQRRSLLKWGAIAAAYIAVAGAGLFYFFYAHSGIEISAGHGELRTWQLADNTIVHLNSDSAISVKFDATRRLVDVERGEVYFEVAKDPSRHFEVRAGNAVLQDIGTSFDVYRQAQETIVSVAEGQVAVRRGPQLNRVAHLRAGEQAAILPSRVIEKHTPDGVRRAIAWLHQEIIFDRTSVAEAAMQFNRYTQTQVVVDDPRIAAIDISGVFHIYDLASFAQFLNELPGVEVMKKGSILHVTGDVRRRAQHE